MTPDSSISLSALWQQRYRTQPPEKLPETETLRLQMAHYSVRDYRPDPLPEGALEAAIAAASSAATSSNLQIWSVVAVHDVEMRKKLVELCGGQRHIAQAPLFLAWVADLSRLERMAGREGHGAEALAYQETFLMATFDTGIAAQNAVLAFESMGLGTLYVGGLRNHPEAVAKLLGLPLRSVAVVGMCVGYCSESIRGEIKPRLSQDVVLHHERYDHEDELCHIAAYDERVDIYQQEQELSLRRWSQTAAGRIARATGLGGRHMMRHVLKRLGFQLK